MEIEKLIQEIRKGDGHLIVTGNEFGITNVMFVPGATDEMAEDLYEDAGEDFYACLLKVEGTNVKKMKERMDGSDEED
jgi:hypothetical protein